MIFGNVILLLTPGLTIQLPHTYQKVRQISNGSYSAVSLVVERGTEGPLLAAKTVQDTTLEGDITSLRRS